MEKRKLEDERRRFIEERRRFEQEKELFEEEKKYYDSGIGSRTDTAEVGTRHYNLDVAI